MISNVSRTIEEALKASELKGELKGKLETTREIAANLLTMDLSIEQIKTATGLTEQEILALKQ